MVRRMHIYKESLLMVRRILYIRLLMGVRIVTDGEAYSQLELLMGVRIVTDGEAYCCIYKRFTDGEAYTFIRFTDGEAYCYIVY